MIKSFDELIRKAEKVKNRIKLISVRPYDESTLGAISKVCEWGNVVPVLVGERKIIEGEIENSGLINLREVEIIDEVSEKDAVETAVKTIKDTGGILMKGNINTAVFLKTIVIEAKNDRKFVSHISLMEIPDFKKILMITDGTVNVYPELKIKIKIIENARDLATSLGYEKPKIAVIGINERLSVNNKDLLECAVISKMNDRGQIGNCYLDGPMPLDTAVSKNAAVNKKITSPVGGDADIIVCSNLESAANLIKGLVHLGKAKTAGLLLGTGYPTVLTSRSDKLESKVISISIAFLNANRELMNNES